MWNYVSIQFLTDNSHMYEKSQNWEEAKTFTFPLLIFFPFNNLSDKVSPHLHKSYMDLLSFKQVSTGKAFTGEQLLQGLQGVGSLSERPYDSIEALYCITGVASIVCKNKFPITVSINNTIKKKKSTFFAKRLRHLQPPLLMFGLHTVTSSNAKLTLAYCWNQRAFSILTSYEKCRAI